MSQATAAVGSEGRARVLFPPKFKFACFVFSGFPVTPDVPSESEMAPGLWMFREVPFALEPPWREWLGSLRVDYVRRANFVLCAVAGSSAPELLDAENEALRNRVNATLYGLLLQGVPDYDHNGISLVGGGSRERTEVRQVAELRTFYPSVDMPHHGVGMREIAWAAQVAPVLESIRAGDSDWNRLQRGLVAFFDGIRMRHAGDRLHQFVRALEGLVKPENGKTRRQFAHRCQTFTGASATAKVSLDEMFHIRSRVEHLHSPLDALSGDTSVRIETANRRTRQAEVLASRAFIHVLESTPLLDIFKSDSGIDDFWRRKDHERAAVWGDVCDLNAVS